MTKYASGVATSLAVRDPAAEFTFIVDDSSGLGAASFPTHSEFLPRGAPTASSIRRTLASIAPDALITTAQRIPDSAFVSAAREADVFTCMFQHGLYIPFMKREPMLFLRKAAKSWSYVRYAAAVSDFHGRSRSHYIREFTAIFAFGARYADARIEHSKLNVDLVLLNGEHWRSFHEEQFAYPPDHQVVVGYPDYDQLPQIESHPRVDCVCYIAQTLVEHGRLSASEFEDFLDKLAGSLHGARLIVKLHPASNLDLYGPLMGLPNVEFSREQLPRATHYVGHYSTYLALVPFLSRNLYLWEFEGHAIPQCLRAAASEIGADVRQLEAFIHSAECSEPTSEGVDAWQHFFFRGHTPAYDAAAEEILARLR